MSAQVRTAVDEAGIARVELHHPERFNAMTRAMWAQLRASFLSLQQDPRVRVILIWGRGHFCAGGDISEYPAFRFDPGALRAFHEHEVWGALDAMLACDAPIVAAIEGNCMGAGLEIASCCDLRLASADARFGAPIARLGFPMAAREAALLMRVLGESTARALLLGAGVLAAERLWQQGFLHECVAAAPVQDCAERLAQRLSSLSASAARLNKQTFRVLALDTIDANATDMIANAYAYADSPDHREGILAFLEKRAPRFE